MGDVANLFPEKARRMRAHGGGGEGRGSGDFSECLLGVYCCSGLQTLDPISDPGDRIALWLSNFQDGGEAREN